MKKRTKTGFGGLSRKALWFALLLAAAVTVYGIAQAAVVSHSPSEISPQGAGSGLDADFLQGLTAADIISASILGSNAIKIAVTPINWSAIQVCQHGTCCPPWKDCDGDGKTYQSENDCDEGCPTCYVGSTEYTTSPDGKDQNCDGSVDERNYIDHTTSCSGLVNVLMTGIRSGCESWCSSRGWEYYMHTCNNVFQSVPRYWSYLRYNFGSCGRGGSVISSGEEMCGQNEDQEASQPEIRGTAQCWCKGSEYQ